MMLENLQSLSYRELQIQCKSAGVKANGKREELLRRLVKVRQSREHSSCLKPSYAIPTDRIVFGTVVLRKKSLSVFNAHVFFELDSIFASQLSRMIPAAGALFCTTDSRFPRTAPGVPVPSIEKRLDFLLHNV